MTQKLTGPALVAYLRQFPSSDDREWAADEIERLRARLEEMVDIADRVDGWQSFPQEPINKARAALAQEQGEKHDS